MSQELLKMFLDSIFSKPEEETIQEPTLDIPSDGITNTLSMPANIPPLSEEETIQTLPR